MTLETKKLLAGLPGEEEIATGLEDASAGRLTASACLIAIASPRLRAAGLLEDTFDFGFMPPLDAEIVLYRLLQETCGDRAYSRYNALLRLLVSFQRALARRLAHRASSVLLP